MAPSPLAVARPALAQHQTPIFAHRHIRAQVNALLHLARPRPHPSLLGRCCKVQIVRHASRNAPQEVGRSRSNDKGERTLKEETPASELQSEMKKQDDLGMFPG